jgi:hypothetical protein
MGWTVPERKQDVAAELDPAGPAVGADIAPVLSGPRELPH